MFGNCASWARRGTPVKNDQVTSGRSRQLPIPLHQAQALIQVHRNSLSNKASGFKARGRILPWLGCFEPDIGKLLHAIGRLVLVVRAVLTSSGVRPNLLESGASVTHKVLTENVKDC